MKQTFHMGNRNRFYDSMEPNTLLALFSGVEQRKTNEAWGIGFRVEDNCLVTEDGCENLSAGIPRTIPELEDLIGR